MSQQQPLTSFFSGFKTQVSREPKRSFPIDVEIEAKKAKVASAVGAESDADDEVEELFDSDEPSTEPLKSCSKSSKKKKDIILFSMNGWIL